MLSYLGSIIQHGLFMISPMKESKKHCFYLDESGYNLNEVVVTYQDIEKLLRKRHQKHSPTATTTVK